MQIVLSDGNATGVTCSGVDGMSGGFTSVVSTTAVGSIGSDGCSPSLGGVTSEMINVDGEGNNNDQVITENFSYLQVPFSPLVQVDHIALGFFVL